MAKLKRKSSRQKRDPALKSTKVIITSRKAAALKKKTCLACSGTFYARRNHAKYCSQRCRTVASRGATFMGVPVREL